MKAIYVWFEDDEFRRLCDIKRKMTWRRFILKGVGLPYEVKDM